MGDFPLFETELWKYDCLKNNSLSFWLFMEFWKILIGMHHYNQLLAICSQHCTHGTDLIAADTLWIPFSAPAPKNIGSVEMWKFFQFHKRLAECCEAYLSEEKSVNIRQCLFYLFHDLVIRTECAKNWKNTDDMNYTFMWS